MATRTSLETTTTAGVIRKGTLERIHDEGDLVVRFPGESQPRVCDALREPTGASLALSEGDTVLVWYADDGHRGCILGAIGPYRRTVARKLELAAEDELTIRCGEGSISILGSGKVVIEGIDIVSRARRSHRIRGGSIQLN